MNRFSSILVAAGLLAGAAPAAATIAIVNNTATLTSASIGSSFQVNYNGIVGGNEQPGLAAALTFELTGISNGGRSWQFLTSITNLSQAPMTSARISGFGFGLQGYDAGLAQVDITSSAVSADPNGPATPIFGERLRDNVLGTNVNVAQLGRIADACFMFGSGTANNCNGGGGGGLSMANPFPSTSQVMTLTFARSLTSLDLFDLFVRWQSLDNDDSGVGRGTIVTGGGPLDPGGDPIPEPSSWALLIAGFGLTGAVLRRRRAAALA